MQKLILPLAFVAVAVAALVWAMLPAETQVRAAGPDDTVADQTPGHRPAAVRKGRPQVAANRPSKRPVRNSLSPMKRPKRRVVTERSRRAHSNAGSNNVGSNNDRSNSTGANSVAHAPHQMPKVAVGTLKDSVRAYYANLPKLGPMPAKIYADEVLPDEVLELANVPEGSLLTQLGTWPTSSIKGFKEVFDIPETGDGVIGFTVLRPDGTTFRDYISTHE